MTYDTMINYTQDLRFLDGPARIDTGVIVCTQTDLDTVSVQIARFCPGEIIEVHNMLDILTSVYERTKAVFPESFVDVNLACKRYLESMAAENICDIQPAAEGVMLLKAILRHVKKGAEFDFDISDVIQKLSTHPNMETGETAACLGSEKPNPMESVLISESDMEIMADFVGEAEENLESIEVSLIELEQNPSDMEILNNIFRVFHTIKGVSGFLALDKINILSHATEDLLEHARSREFIINDIATNTILESVDCLKLMISRVKQGLVNGVRQMDNDIDITGLIDQLKNLLIHQGNAGHEPIGEILVKKGVIDRNTLEASLKSQETIPDKKLGEILIDKNKAGAKDVANALQDQKKTLQTMESRVKVSTSKLDDLVDYAGELVIAQSMVRQNAPKDSSLYQSIMHLGQIVTQMQNIAMSMRMIPIKATFMKMIRLLRDLSQKSGKKVILDMSGDETEIDRNVVDALYEPMVHMIRNSVDHGIESAMERVAAGKPEQGKISLRAYHKGGDIIIEIEDDGKGLDRDKILEKALNNGLVSKDDKLTDTQIYNLILHPGFSTASQITDISGRGVGMDVVKDGIEKFRGHLGISTQKGLGTKFTISLPLTMAIIDGMLVRVGKEKYVVPTMAVKRVFRPEKDNCFTVEGKGEMIKQENNLIPLMRLKRLYENEESSTPLWESLVVVVESKGEQSGLVIDELMGKDEYVIKSLGESLVNVSCFAGGAVLSDGRVGLILDIQGVFQRFLSGK